MLVTRVSPVRSIRRTPRRRWTGDFAAGVAERGRGFRDRVGTLRWSGAATVDAPPKPVGLAPRGKLGSGMNDQQRVLAERIEHSERAVVFTGAGISTESGIPDFRSAGTGLWNKIKPIEFQDFIASEETRRESWRRRLSSAGWSDAKPNAGHLAVAQYVAQGVVRAVITQNVDGLHQAAGVPDEQVIELHGNTSYCTCLDCKKRFEMDWVRQVFADNETVPYCDACNGIVKSATISFGQPMPEDAMHKARDETSLCDLFLVMGSSLVVYPAAGFPEIAKRHGAYLAIINREPTDADRLADLVIHGEIGPVISAVAEFHSNKGTA